MKKTSLLITLLDYLLDFSDGNSDPWTMFLPLSALGPGKNIAVMFIFCPGILIK